MTTKINGVDGRPVAVSAGTPVRRGSDTQSGKQESANPVADVHITDTARTLASIEQSVRELPAVDEKRVAAVQDALRDGRYSVDPQRVADKMLHLELELTNVMSSKAPAEA